MKSVPIPRPLAAVLIVLAATGLIVALVQVGSAQEDPVTEKGHCWDHWLCLDPPTQVPPTPTPVPYCDLHPLSCLDSSTANRHSNPADSSTANRALQSHSSPRPLDSSTPY